MVQATRECQGGTSNKWEHQGGTSDKEEGHGVLDSREAPTMKGGSKEGPGRHQRGSMSFKTHQDVSTTTTLGGVWVENLEIRRLMERSWRALGGYGALAEGALRILMRILCDFLHS